MWDEFISMVLKLNTIRYKSHNPLDCQGITADAHLDSSFHFWHDLGQDLCLSKVSPSPFFDIVCPFFSWYPFLYLQPFTGEWFWQAQRICFHVYTTAIYIFWLLLGVLHRAQHAASWCGALPHWSHGLCSWCPKSFESIVFQRPEFSSLAQPSMFTIDVQDDGDNQSMHINKSEL